MKIIIQSLVLISLVFTQNYSVGEQVSVFHQNAEFEVCYGAEEHGYIDGLVPKLSLSDFNGFANGGIFHVIMIDMSASW